MKARYRNQGKARYWLAGSALAAAGTALWILTRRSTPGRPRTHLLDLEPSPEIPAPETGSVQFIGTATTLIRYGGLTILTDPNFLHRGDRIHLGYGMHATRLTDPAREFEDLPPVDFVLLSHLHEDHFDKLVERRLDPHTPILTTASAARTLARRGFVNTYALRTWDCVNVRKGPVSLRVTALPGRHGPLLVSAAMPDVMGSMLEFRHDPDGRHYRIYVSGDTLVFRDLYEIPRRSPPGGSGAPAPGRSPCARRAGHHECRPGHRGAAHYPPGCSPSPSTTTITTCSKSRSKNSCAPLSARDGSDRVRCLRHGETYSFAPRGTPLEARPLV